MGKTTVFWKHWFDIEDFRFWGWLYFWTQKMWLIITNTFLCFIFSVVLEVIQLTIGYITPDVPIVQAGKTKQYVIPAQQLVMDS